MSTPRINPNDPKWTAYVLGELDEAEREAVERLLETSPEARAFVDELKTTSAALEDALASEPAVMLTPEQRTAVLTASDARASLARRSLSVGRLRFASEPTQWGWGLGAAAATLLIAAVLTMPRAPRSQDSNDVATTSPPPAATPPLPGQSVQPPSAELSTSAAPPAAGSTARRGATAAPVVSIEEFARLNTGATNRTTNATLTGAVRDASGSAIPGVTVTAVNSATGAVASTMTDGEGRYTFSNLEAGPEYRVTATMRGFQAASADLRADPLRSAQRDFTMAVGSLAETITVTGETPVTDLQATRREIAGQGGRGGGTGRGGVAGGVVGNAPPSAFKTAPPPPAAPGPAAEAGIAGRVFQPPLASPPADAIRSLPGGIPRPAIGTESYTRVAENAFVRVRQEPLATFSIDVDTASYSNVRRFLNQNQLPPADAVRIEELVNYFTYDYPRPSGPHPIGASMEVAAAPWNSRHRLVRIGIKAREIEANRRPASNLVFLIDVSGSMNTPQKLPLVKSGLKMLVDQLGENDVVSMVVYANATGLVLPPTSGERKDVISRAIESLEAGGSTNGGAGIQLAYSQATANFIRGGVNRVILMTDGDFNVGITNQGDLTRLIEDRARSGVFLSVLGFGMGNLKDSTMEQLADKGNGHYAYIDSLNEARKVLVEEMSNTLVTVAKDVKIQVDFNPGKVEAYRLIGYENRALRPEDFNNDLKDAGDMGAGHTVTALFEIVPRGGTVPGPSIDPSVFQPVPRDTPPPASNSNDMLVLRVRYKLPEASESTRMDVPLVDRGATFSNAGSDFRFAASVAAFGMILKNSPYRGDATLEWVLDTAMKSQGRDRSGYRDEFVSLVQKAITLRARAGSQDRLPF